MISRKNFIEFFFLIFSSVAITYFVPNKNSAKFKYNYEIGKNWYYQDLYAPFDFSIKKTEKDIKEEKDKIINNSEVFFKKNKETKKKVINNALISLEKDIDTILYYKQYIIKIIDDIYKLGIIKKYDPKLKNSLIVIIENNKTTNIIYENIPDIKQSIKKLESKVNQIPKNEYIKMVILNSIKNNIVPDLEYDDILTKKILDKNIKNINKTKDLIKKDTRIIAKGDIVEGEKLLHLESLKQEYISKIWAPINYYFAIIGYFFLTFILLTILYIFIKNQHSSIFNNPRKLLMIISNMVAIIIISEVIIQFNYYFLYLVPFSILTIVLSAFFPKTLSLFCHIICIFIVNLILPDNHFKFTYLQVITGIMITIYIKNFHKISNISITIFNAFLLYVFSYIFIIMIQTGNITNIKLFDILIFLGNSILLVILSQPLVFINEKLFNTLSDISLAELCDTNSKLLKELSKKAPGSFQHSLQVSNLCESVASSIGLNTILIKASALYHDIGKMKNPQYFIENQNNNEKTIHQNITPYKSAKIIIDHVNDGVKIAKKYKLPKQIIDFIKTHHGTSLVQYFYHKEKQINENVKEKEFRYPGPKPFSKEMATLMICDSVEAASRTLESPTREKIRNLIDKIVKSQYQDNQYDKSDISFKDLNKIKKIIEDKIVNIYHSRISYPSS